MSPIRLRVRELRDLKGWTQRELADRAKLRQATVSRLENDLPTSIDLTVLDRLSRVFEVDPGYLLVRVDEIPKASTKRRGRR